MNLILIVLTGVLMGAFNFAFFILGYLYRDKKPSTDGVTVTKENKAFIEEMMRWRNYGGEQ